MVVPALKGNIIFVAKGIYWFICHHFCSIIHELAVKLYGICF